MYSLYAKKENAHEDSIWTCAWGRRPERTIEIPETEPEKKETGEEENAEEAKEKPKKTEIIPAVDLIVTGGVDDLVKVWQYDEGELKLRHKLGDHSLGVVSVALSREADMLASSSLDATIHLWNTETGVRIKTIENGPMDAWTVAFSSCSKYILSGSHQGKINMFNIETGVSERHFDTRGKFTLSIATSNDGKYIATGAIDGIISVFEETGKSVHTLEGHAMPIRSLTFSPDSLKLLTGSDDGHMKIYDVSHGTLIATLSGHTSWVLSVSFSPDNEHFVSSSADHTVKVWEVASKLCLHTFSDHADQVWSVSYNADGNKVVSVAEDKNIHVYDIPI